LDIPGYRLLDKIGEGGMGTVYRATQLSLQRTVAIKVLHAAGAGSAPAFQRETRLMAALAHPHVVTIYDCGRVNGHDYMVTEYVPGQTLRSLLKPGQPWPVSRAAVLLDRIAEALAFIHTNGILHLDLKPENVLCGPHGEIKLADFGLARAEVDARALAERGLAQGTMDYCSLEQRSGLETDARSDLFSLAVLAYEVLTGYLPGRVYEPATELNPRLPRAVNDVLRRGLARHPEERYPTVEAFRQDLRAALRRRIWPVAVAVGLVGVVLLAAVLLKLKGLSDAAHEPGPEADAPSGPRWLLYDQPETVTQVGADDEVLGRWFPGVSRLRVEGRYPEGASAPSLPAWPTPRPVLVWQTEDGTGFFHPLPDNPRRWDVVARASRAEGLPALKPEDNAIAAGDFGGPDPLGPDRPWRTIAADRWENGDGITVDTPPDQPGNPALLLTKKDAADPARPVSCYQWMARVPARPGTLMVLRYRARAREPGGRLTLSPEMPLVIPPGDNNSLASWLRDRSSPLRWLRDRPQADVHRYPVADPVAPPTRWQTYSVLWEWPPYCTELDQRNLVISLTGHGQVWVDNIELYPWEEGGPQ
jgi:hypothetical protein